MWSRSIDRVVEMGVVGITSGQVGIDAPFDGIPGGEGTVHLSPTWRVNHCGNG